LKHGIKFGEDHEVQNAKTLEVRNRNQDSIVGDRVTTLSSRKT
jgi:hypothetical protein